MTRHTVGQGQSCSQRYRCPQEQQAEGPGDKAWLAYSPTFLLAVWGVGFSLAPDAHGGASILIVGDRKMALLADCIVLPFPQPAGVLPEITVCISQLGEWSPLHKGLSLIHI